MIKKIKLVLNEKLAPGKQAGKLLTNKKKSISNSNLIEAFSKLKGETYQGPLDYEITEVELNDFQPEIQEDKAAEKRKVISNPKQSDEMTKKRIEKDQAVLKEPGMKELIDRGFIPILSPKTGYKRDSAVLGMGAQGTAYEVGKEGKRYVAKVSEAAGQAGSSSGGLETENEVAIRKKIEQIRQNLPPEVSKHIVRTFHIFQTENGKNNIFIMEPLRPMRNDEAEHLYNIHKDEPQDIFGILNDPNEVYEQIRKSFYRTLNLLYGDTQIEEAAFLSFEEVREHFNNFLINAMKDVYSNINLKREAETKTRTSLCKHIAILFSNYIARLLLKTSSYVMAKREYGLTFELDQLKGTLFEVFNEIFMVMTESKGFHSNSRYFDKTSMNNMRQKQKEFSQAMLYLQEKHLIHWFDLHGGNVMMNANGDYVATDIGLFQDHSKPDDNKPNIMNTRKVDNGAQDFFD